MIYVNFNRSTILSVSFILIGAAQVLSQVSENATLCWAILSKDRDAKISYLFGTVHHAGTEPIFGNEQLITKILKSKFIVLEIDTIEVKKPNVQFDSFAIIGLDSLLSPNDYSMVKREYLKYTGRNLDRDRFRMPLTIISAIRTAKEKNDLHVVQMEAALYTICKKANIPIRGLETRADRAKMLFKNVPLEEQAKILMYDLNEILNPDSVGYHIIKCMENQDLDCLCELDGSGDYSRPGSTSTLIDRNKFWLNKLGEYIQEGNAFIAVGAAHLCGDYGLISLLRKEGFTLIPVRND